MDPVLKKLFELSDAVSLRREEADAALKACETGGTYHALMLSHLAVIDAEMARLSFKREIVLKSITAHEEAA